MCRITLLLVAMLAGGYSVADEIEEPAWQLVKQLDEVEIRQYAPTIQARTPMTEREGSSSGFRRLAGYIFGGNDQEQSIAMNVRLKNRQSVRGELSQFVDEMVVSEAMIK